MTNALLFIAILTCIGINHRREIWKHRAKMQGHVIKELRRRIELEQEANQQMINRIPGSILYKPSADWPEGFDA
jgi:hypothetical protein